MPVNNIEKYIEGLSPELQEKARGCTTAEELLKLADENDVELPQEALEAVSGGCGEKPKAKLPCERCGSNETYYVWRGGAHSKTQVILCKSCGYELNWFESQERKKGL